MEADEERMFRLRRMPLEPVMLYARVTLSPAGLPPSRMTPT